MSQRNGQNGQYGQNGQNGQTGQSVSKGPRGQPALTVLAFLASPLAPSSAWCPLFSSSPGRLEAIFQKQCNSIQLGSSRNSNTAIQILTGIPTHFLCFSIPIRIEFASRGAARFARQSSAVHATLHAREQNATRGSAIRPAKTRRDVTSRTL